MMSRRWERRIAVICLIVAVFSLMSGVVFGDWVYVALGAGGLAVNLVCLGFDGAGPFAGWFARSHARLMVDLIDSSLPVLHAQAEERPEVADQIAWTSDTLRGHRHTLTAYLNNEPGKPTARETVAACDRVGVELAPSAEQIAVDRPTRFNISYARHAQRRAVRWKP